MRVSKFIKVDTDVLLEWIYDDNNFISEDYRIIINTLEDTRAFSQTETTGVIPNTTNNETIHQLFPVNEQINKWGIVDPDPQTNRYPILQYQKFPGNVPHRYDTVRLHFPVNYTFKDKLGVLLRISLLTQDQRNKFSLSEYYFDKSDPDRSTLEITLAAPPFLFQEVLWGKYIEIKIPSPEVVINDVTINNGTRMPREGSIHKNLVEDDVNVLSNESPIFLDFSFLTKKQTQLSQTSYLTTEPFSTTLPVVPEFEQLGLKIQPAGEGLDYFEIFGTYSGTLSQFEDFIDNARLMGKNFYVLYEVCTFEKNIKTQQVTFSKFENFDLPIDFRPIIKFSTTTATIDVTMKLVDARDDSIIIRRASYSMLQDEVGKYSVNLTKIDVRDTFKPKIYNAKPDQINLQIGNSLSNKKVVKVPFAVMYERYNIQTRNKTEDINDTTWYGTGQQQILLYPQDNVVKFAIGQGTNEDGIVPYQIPEGTPVYIQFKSSKKIVEVPLFYESGEINLSGGIVVFRILSSQVETIREIKKDGFDQFYIIYKADNGVETLVYPGRYLIYNEN
jgi:hypothetical protein